MNRYHLTMVSSNRKTGPIPVSTTSRDSCPTSCALRENGCYAEHGPLRLHWDKVSHGERGMNILEFCDKVRRLPRGQLWRHNQAGDLPGDGVNINMIHLNEIAMANAGKRGFTYTHYRGAKNMAIVRQINQSGFTINLSANSPAEADKLLVWGLPVTAVIPSDERPTHTPGGTRIKLCPAQVKDAVSCWNCGLCAKADRSYVIGFLSHGTGMRKADIIARG